MEILDFKSQLQQIASDAGFSAVGITDPLKVDQTIKEKFRDFIKNDWNAGMDWLEKRINERIAPENLWPSVKSILVFTDDYTPAEDPLKKLVDKELSNISVYATKRDYHKVVKSKLKIVASWVKKKLDCELKIFVDTAPVMEKPLAQLSGLGWQGKHTNLVSRNMGNWFFIGVMYIDKSLPADEPEQDNCGSCTKCLDICPTNAFEGAYKLDARKCIAYLTIEHKGAIDKELRSSIGNRVFGCDDCLAVCPWNKFASKSKEIKFLTNKKEEDLKLSKLSKLSDQEFRNFFSSSPIKRIGRNRFIRNVLIAIGNSDNRSLSKDALDNLNDESPLVRGAAIWALRKLLNNKEISNIKKKYIINEKDRSVISEWDNDIS